MGCQQVSIFAIEWEDRIGLDKVVMVSPRQSRTITPIPAVLEALKTATSKLSL